MQNIIIISNSLQIFLVWKGGVWGGCPLKSYENFAIFKLHLCDWMQTFRYYSERNKGSRFYDSPSPFRQLENCRGRYGLTLEWNTDPIFSHLNLSSVTVFSRSPAISVSSYTFSIEFFPVFSPPPFPCLLHFFKQFVGVFYTHNTSFPLALLSLSFLFPSLFLSPLSFLFLSFSSFSLSLSLSLSRLADFWCGDRRHAAPLPTGLVTILKPFPLGSTTCIFFFLISCSIAFLFLAQGAKFLKGFCAPYYFYCHYHYLPMDPSHQMIPRQVFWSHQSLPVGQTVGKITGGKKNCFVIMKCLTLCKNPVYLIKIFELEIYQKKKKKKKKKKTWNKVHFSWMTMI